MRGGAQGGFSFADYGIAGYNSKELAHGESSSISRFY
jgi:hypothetical protein